MKQNVIGQYIWGFAIMFWAVILCVFASNTRVNAANVWWLSDVPVFSRAQRGADESWRYSTRPEYSSAIAKAAAAAASQSDGDDSDQKQSTSQIALKYVLDAFGGEFVIHRVRKAEWWKKLYWPLQIVKKKTKILVHHTASEPGSIRTIDDEKQYIQGVYKYHAFTRWRGDIWYNFMIMPSGRIYEWRKGGVWVVGAHATWNNSPSIGIALVGNFVAATPTQAQIDALAALSTSLATQYTIDPNESTVYFRKSTSRPYIEVTTHPRIAGHTDAGWTACPGAKLYELLPALREEISHRLAGQAPQQIIVPSIVSVVWQQWWTQLWWLSSPTPAWWLLPKTPREAYCTTSSCVSSKAVVQRMDEAPSLADIPALLRTPVRVLLYDVSTTHTTWDLQCEGTCFLQYPGGKRRVSSAMITEESTWFLITRSGGAVHKEKVAYTASKEWAVKINNYERKTSDWIGLNVWRESLLFTTGPLKKIWGGVETAHQVINVVSYDHYMQGIGEATDSQSQTKANVLALLAKQYVLFYTNTAARHPSIPEGAVYNTIDDPRLFQKYLGKGRESISSKWPRALDATRTRVVAYDQKVPLLPYFHCSAGFTRSAQEKRGWTDTPYLMSVSDELGACESEQFEGHGVWLSGKWASAMADAGKSMEDIIEYYYPGVKVTEMR
jgi:N-acetylmuramoyl-L-alanine amidase